MGCLVGRVGGNFYVGPKHFLPGQKMLGPTQNLSLQNRKKTRWGVFDGEMTKLPMCSADGQSLVAFFFPIWFPRQRCLLFFLLLLFYIFFSSDFLGMVLCVFFFLLIVSWATFSPRFYFYFFYFFFLLISWVWCFVFLFILFF